MKLEQVALIILAAALCAVVALFVIKLISGRSSKTVTIDTIVGEKCVVTEKIDNFAGCGQIKIKGQLWSACSFFDDDVFDCGEQLRIVAIEGVRVVCKKD